MVEKFNLEEAINGRAFYLRNGYRGVIKYCVDDRLTQEEKTPRFAYVGYVLDEQGFLHRTSVSWDKDGITNEPKSYDAVGMVELSHNEKEQMEKRKMSEDILINVQEVRKMWAQRYKEGLAVVNNAIIKESTYRKSVYVSDEELKRAGCYYNDDMLLDKIRAQGYTVDVIEPCRGEEGGISISGW
nr:MAG TPA: hypothetical protein [Caudoviricetes sp.]